MKSLTSTFLFLVTSASVLLAQENGFHLDKEYTINKTGTVDITSSDARVFITGSSRISAHVKIDRKVTSKGLVWGEEEFRVDVKEEGGNLILQEKKNSTSVGVVGYYNEEYRIEIEVPDGVSLKVRGDDGDYYIKSVHGAIVMSLDDADAELAGCKGNAFEFRLDDGDIRMDEGKGTLHVSGDDADVEIYKGNFSTIRANIDDGDLIIETSLIDNGEYSLQAKDGAIVLSISGGGGEFDIRHDDSHIITEGEFKLIEKSDTQTRVALASGKAKVSIRADDGRVRLSVR